jgi:4-hydroxy-2-oxoglutarate aldolase
MTPTPKLEGVIAAIPTPFNDNEDLDLDALRSNLARWNETELYGYTVLGTTGEFVALSLEEKTRLLAVARTEIPREKVLVAGTGTESSRETLELIKWAGSEGYDFALVITPSYNRWSFVKDSLVAYYTMIAEESEIPVLVYHIPACTGLTLAPDTVARIAEHPNIAGIKDSSGDVFAIQETRRVCPPEFAVLTGSAKVLFASLMSGASGAILADACCVPGLTVETYHAVREGRLDDARALQDRIVPLSNVLIGRYGIPGVKGLLSAMGYSGGHPRRPLLPISKDDVAELERSLRLAVGEASSS